MSVPTNVRARYVRKFLVIGPRIYERVINENPLETGQDEAARFPPVPRITSGGQDVGPLCMMWRNVERTFSALNSFAQAIGETGSRPVSSYSWSAGGSSSTRAYTLSTAGLNNFTCTVTDDNGALTQAKRYVKVVNPPGVGDPSTWPITSFRVDSLTETLSESGWGGCTMRLTLWGVDASLFVPGTTVALYVERYEGSSAETATLVSAGEEFSGFITEQRRDIHPQRSEFSVVCRTLEGLYARRGRDTGDHVFLDRSIFQMLGTIDPMLGFLPPETATFYQLYPWHEMQWLSLHKAAVHLLHWHTKMGVDENLDGTPEAEYSAIQLCGASWDWWNFPDPQKAVVWGLNVPRGNLFSGIANLVPSLLWRCYCSRTSVPSISLIHEAKATPDGVTAIIDPSLTYAPITVEPYDDHPVSQVKLFQTPASLSDLTLASLTTLIRKYPSTPDSVGSIRQPSQPLWFTTPEIGDEWAEAIYKFENATKRVKVTLPGSTFGIFSVAQMTYAPLGWTNKKSFAVQVNHHFDWPEPGGYRTTVELKEIG